MGFGGDREDAEQTVTPAVAKNPSGDIANAQQAQAEAKARLRGIRSTYSRFSNLGNGTQSKLG